MVQKSQGQPPGMVLFYPINNGINYYQPQLVSRSRISEPPTVSIVTTLAPWLYRSQETVTRAGSRRLDNHRRNFEITSHQRHERSEKTFFFATSKSSRFFKGYLVPFFISIHSIPTKKGTAIPVFHTFLDGWGVSKG